MTDELMAARLHAAGENWRSANKGVASSPDEPTMPLQFEPPKPTHRTRWVTIASSAVVAAALVVGGVLFARDGTHVGRTSTTKATSQLDGVTWHDQNSTATVVFTAHTARTFDGCSNALYRLTVDGAHLRLGKAIGEPSTCGGVTVADARAAANLATFYQVLRGPSRWSVAGKVLTLTGTSGATVTLTTSGERAPSLVDSDWTLERVETDTTLPGSFSSATLSFTATRKFVANDLCNTLSGTVRTGADTIDFGEVASTEIACLDPGFTPATTVIDKVLTGTVTYSIRGNELILSKPDGSLLVYVPASAKSTGGDVDALTARPWTLTGTETTTTSSGSSSGSGSSAVSLSVVEFDGIGGFTVRHRCYTNKGQAQLAAGSADLSHVTLKMAIPCASNAETAAGQRENGFVDALLTGHVTWSISGTQLTISQANGHSATFSRKR